VAGDGRVATAVSYVLALPRWRRFAVLISIGALAALGQAPVGAWPITLVALAMVFGLFQRARGWRAAAWSGWAVGTGYF